MTGRVRVLWVEDGADAELGKIYGALDLEPTVNLTVARDPTEAMRWCLSQEFDVVIVDIRLPPGDQQEWVTLYDERGHSRTQARLGIDLIQSLLAIDGARVALGAPVTWVSADRLAVLTVEMKSGVSGQVAPWGVHRVYEKGEEHNRAENGLPLGLRIVHDVLTQRGIAVEFVWYGP